MSPAEHLAVPYIVIMESVPGPNGQWVCRATHPELPEVSAEHPRATEALERLEAVRVARILELLGRGAPVPLPRQPLAHRIREFEALLEQQR
jgi:hypothetical protein